jgi:hypothetical protein
MIFNDVEGKSIDINSFAGDGIWILNYEKDSYINDCYNPIFELYFDKKTAINIAKTILKITQKEI